MTVHSIQLMTSNDVDTQKVRNKIADMKTKYGEKLSKQAAPFDQGQNMDGSVSFYQGIFRVTLNDKETEKNDLMEQIRKEMDKSASWWQIRWHECTPDGTTRTDSNGEEVKGCSWENVQKSDSSMIPDEVEY